MCHRNLLCERPGLGAGREEIGGSEMNEIHKMIVIDNDIGGDVHMSSKKLGLHCRAGTDQR